MSILVIAVFSVTILTLLFHYARFFVLCKKEGVLAVKCKLCAGCNYHFGYHFACYVGILFFPCKSV